MEAYIQEVEDIYDLTEKSFTGVSTKAFTKASIKVASMKVSN